MNVEARGLTVRFGRHAAISGIDLRMATGEVLAVVGPNGSGKSTLLRALAGIVAHTGRVTWDGDGSVAADNVGYMPQDNALRAMLTAFEVVLLGRMRSLSFRVAPADLAAAAAAFDELGIGDLAERRIGELSGGQRQLVFLAQVLAGNPRVLLLDEPTSALDIAHQLQVLQMLRAVTRRRALTTLVVLHDLNAAARHADRVALLDRGKLVEIGTPAVVLRPDALRAAFGIETAILEGPNGHLVVVPLGVTSPAPSEAASMVGAS